MKASVTTLAVILFTVFGVETNGQAPQVKVEDAVASALQTYATSWNSADARALADLYTVNADYTGFGSVMTRGREEIQGRYESMFTGGFAGSQLSMQMSSLRLIRPDVAVVDGQIEMIGLRDQKDPSQIFHGQFIAIMTQDEGEWRFTTFWSKQLQPAVAHAD